MFPARIAVILLLSTSLIQTVAPVLADVTETLTVSGTVPASPSDFSVSLSAIPTGNVSQDQTITYEVRYGSSLPYATNITLEADWSLGTIQGSSTPSVNLLSYVVGSAGTAHGNTSAVVDTVNRTISWTISSFPANTSKTVSFQLKTNTYTESSPVDFTVSSRIEGPGVTTTDATVTKNYQYTDNTPTATPTPGPTNTAVPPTGVPVTATPAPTIAPKQALRITNISVETIATNEAIILISTSKPSSIRLRYGTTINTNQSTITSLEKRTETILKFSSLKTNTRYYFRVTAQEGDESITSDIFTFQTAKTPANISLKEDSLIITSNHVLLSFPSKTKENYPSIILPQDTTFEMNFQMSNPELIQSIRGSIFNAKVLGLTTIIPPAEASTDSVSLFSLKDGQFSGRLKTENPSVYDIFLRVSDYNGNISDKKIAQLFVKKLLSIYEEGSGRPIENAAVTISIYKEKEQLYKIIPPSSLAVPNPAFSDEEGNVRIVLPENKYRIDVIANGYEKKEVNFTLGPHEQDSYPTVYLKKSKFNVINQLIDLIDIGSSTVKTAQSNILDLAKSYRFFRLNAALILLCFVLLTYSAFAARLRMYFHHIPHHFVNYWHWAKKPKEERGRLIGTVFDPKTRFPITRATVMLFTKNDRLVAQSQTDRKGVFYLPIHTINTFKLLITKPGYTVYEKPIKEITTEVLSLPLSQKEPREFIHVFLEIAETVIGSLFEVLLIITFILEIFLSSTFGLGETFPFLILSCINFLLWMFLVISHFHVRHLA